MLWTPSLYLPMGKKPAVAASYTGPGDIVGSALAWYGLRAYSNATIGANAIRLVRASDSTQQDFVTLANGDLDVASINTFLTSTTGKVVTFYDQTGNARHLTQGTDAARPNWSSSSPGTKSTGSVSLTAASSQSLSTSGTITQSQPVTWSLVLKHAAGDLFGAVDLAAVQQGANTIRMLSGGAFVLDSTLTDSTWGAGQFIFNGASSAGYIDGSISGTGDAGATGISGRTIDIGFVVFSSAMTGSVVEMGLWAAAFTTGGGQQASSMNSNQHTYYGF